MIVAGYLILAEETSHGCDYSQRPTAYCRSGSTTPLLWVLRDTLGLTGTKYGCGMALCGSCTVLLEDEPIRSCVTPVAAVSRRKLTIIEELCLTVATRCSARLAEEVPQCGFCQSSQILTAVALLAKNLLL